MVSELLATGTGGLVPDRAAASVYELLLAELACAIARENAPIGWRWAVGGGLSRAVPGTSFGARH